jgi:uncharacterized protein YkwD
VRLDHRLARRCAKLVTALTMTVAALGASTALATPALASPAGDLAAATNAARAAAGLPALQRNAQLDAVAQAWAQHLASTNVLAHNPGLRSQVSNWSVLGENVGRAGDIPSVQRAFMNSPEHRANILDPRYTQMGVGAAVSTFPSCGCQQLWVVVDFKRPQTVAPPPAPKVAPAPAPPQPVAAPKPAAQAPKPPAQPPAQAPKPAVKQPAKAPSRPPSVQQAPPSAVPPTPRSSATPEVPSASASATALRSQLVAAAATPPATITATDPVSRVLSFASLVAGESG